MPHWETRSPGPGPQLHYPETEPASPLLTDAHSCSRMLIAAHRCSQLLTDAHICSQLLTAAHSCSQLLSAAHSSSQPLTAAHRCSQPLIYAHRCSSGPAYGTLVSYVPENLGTAAGCELLSPGDSASCWRDMGEKVGVW